MNAPLGAESSPWTKVTGSGAGVCIQVMDAAIKEVEQNNRVVALVGSPIVGFGETSGRGA